MLEQYGGAERRMLVKMDKNASSSRIVVLIVDATKYGSLHTDHHKPNRKNRNQGEKYRTQDLDG